MAEVPTLDRAGPLAGRRSATVAALPPGLRLSLRGEVAALAPLATAFGLAPGTDACRAVTEGDRAALWLGPDEWLLVGPDDEAAAGVPTRCAAALADVPHSLVDVSQRNAGFVVAGTGATTLLAEGCPLDLGLPACPVGFCSRTVLGKAEIVLWREAEDRFRIECWRSFAPYLSAFLAQAAENL